MKILRTDYRHPPARAAHALDALRADLMAAGWRPTHTGPLDLLHVASGRRVATDIRIGAQPGSASLVASWGPTGARKAYKEPRDGFDSEDIAVQIMTWAAGQLTAQADEGTEQGRRRAAALALAASINADFGPAIKPLDEYSGASITVSPAGFLRFEIRRQLTEAQARRLLEVARELQIIP